MAVYEAPLEDIRFILSDLLKIERYANLPGFADASPDVVDAILNEGAKISQDVLLPLNETGDRQGCTYDAEGRAVKTPDGFQDAYKLFAEGGWVGLTSVPDYGGQGMPAVLGLAFNEMVSSTNMAFGMYPGLSHGCYSALLHHGSEEQRQTYLPNIIAGEWSGTMNLTEPQCGTDLGLIRTKAEPQSDGTFKISGTKIWISGGEQDLTSNIVHLVLAKIPGGPDGIKGISLFLVPKFLVKEDGSLGERNPVFCGGLESKMGIHGNATCVMNYEGATGYLVGEEHKGMRAMFTMMNEARLGVGLQGLAMSEIAYQNALAFARDRRQGRALTGPAEPDQPADSILVHPDVRRMLMDVRSFNEGARALLMWTGLWGDLEHKAEDPAVREKAGDYMALFTPIIKSFFTERGFANAALAQQVLGGSGFVKDYPLEQFVRDARITMIYEGTNGIQALDLVGRKLMANNGRAVTTFFADVEALVTDCKGQAELAPFVTSLETSVAHLKEATDWMGQNALADFNNAGATAADYLSLFAITALGYVWLETARTCVTRLGEGVTNPDFYKTKLTTGRYFVARHAPEAALHLARLKTGAEPVMALTADQL